MVLILASASASRRAMLEAAGLAFAVQPAELDEASVERDHSGPPRALAAKLARAKALTVSALAPDHWVIGSDSVVAVDDRRFAKPATAAEARDHLRAFSGRPMQLSSAVALARGGDIIWHHVGEATLRIRTLSDRFIDEYLGAEWPAVAACVGVFRMEGRGVHLFEQIEGDHFTILGLPLLPLLGALRAQGVVPS